MFGEVILEEGQFVDLKGLLARVSPAKALMLLVAEETRVSPDDLTDLAACSDFEVFGGVFPGLIYKGRLFRRGVLVATLLEPVQVVTVPSLERAPRLQLDGSVLVILDGMASSISEFLHSMFASCKSTPSFIGGGAGRSNLNRNPCLFSREGAFCGGAVLAISPFPMGVGISHGWEAFKGPYVATSAQGSILRELNWRPAFHVYKEAIQNFLPFPLTPDNFWEVSKNFPLGMARLDGNIVVRDPVRVEPDGSLVLVGEVPENAVLMLMRGQPEKLVQAAKEAAHSAYSAYTSSSNSPPRFALVADCVSRVLYLGNRVEEELQAIDQALPAGIQTFGFLSLGEVACTDGSYLEFHNKTTVVGVS